MDWLTFIQSMVHFSIMWKTFDYNRRQRVAFLPEKGPAYQVIDDGKMVTGFRAFVPEKMQNVASADNLFLMLPDDLVQQYPELEKAK